MDIASSKIINECVNTFFSTIENGGGKYADCLPVIEDLIDKVDDNVLVTSLRYIDINADDYYKLLSKVDSKYYEEIFGERIINNKLNVEILIKIFDLGYKPSDDVVFLLFKSCLTFHKNDVFKRCADYFHVNPTLANECLQYMDNRCYRDKNNLKEFLIKYGASTDEIY
jgi:hypothetical protein